MTKSKFKSCFISAPQSADTSPLRHALDNRKIRWADVANARPGSSILATIQTSIATVDFVCGFIPSNLGSASVFVEIGIALGKNRPVLVFVEPGLDVPTYFNNVNYAPVNVKDVEAISLHLDAFLQHARLGGISKARRPSEKAPRRVVKDAWAIQTWNRLKAASPTGLAFEGFISDLFRRSGAAVSRLPSPGDYGADMAVWIDQFESTIGNPLLVEVRYGQLSNAKLDQAEDQLRSYLSRKMGQAGLLVYGDREEKIFSSFPQRWPLVVRLSIGELISLLGSGKFVQTVLEQRNRVAHGAS